jgi:hypothetical protein
MITEVIKGVDDAIEFKGFKGRYFYMLAGSIVSLLVLTFIMYSIGLNSIFLMAFALMIGIGAYMYIKFIMDKNGKYGHIHAKHQQSGLQLLHNVPFHKILK